MVKKLRLKSLFQMQNIEKSNLKVYQISLFLNQLMLYVPVNSLGQVGTLPPVNGTLTQNEVVMTSNNCFKYNYPTKPKGLICADGSTCNHFSWAGTNMSGKPVIR